MDQSPQNSSGNIPQPAEGFGSVRNDSEGFGKVLNDSEGFGTVRNDAEGFRNIPKGSERTENHTLTVREAAKLFEAAGVARTERSIVNWCQPNRHGICRLDCYFDPNERRYYLTPQSVERVIQEEIQRSKKPAEPPASESFGNVPNEAEKPDARVRNHSVSREIKELENEIRDLQITNKAKDIVIERMQKERDGFFEQLLTATRKVGTLEARLLQIESSADSQ